MVYRIFSKVCRLPCRSDADRNNNELMGCVLRMQTRIILQALTPVQPNMNVIVSRLPAYSIDNQSIFFVNITVSSEKKLIADVLVSAGIERPFGCRARDSLN